MVYGRQPLASTQNKPLPQISVSVIPTTPCFPRMDRPPPRTARPPTLQPPRPIPWMSPRAFATPASPPAHDRQSALPAADSVAPVQRPLRVRLRSTASAALPCTTRVYAIPGYPPFEAADNRPPRKLQNGFAQRRTTLARTGPSQPSQQPPRLQSGTNLTN